MWPFKTKGCSIFLNVHKKKFTLIVFISIKITQGNDLRMLLVVSTCLMYELEAKDILFYIFFFMRKEKPNLKCLTFSVYTKASFFIFAFYFHSDEDGMWSSALGHYAALCGHSLWLRFTFTITYFYKDPEMQPAHLVILSPLLSSLQNEDSFPFSEPF